MLTASPKTPWKTLKELDDAKKRPADHGRRDARLDQPLLPGAHRESERGEVQVRFYEGLAAAHELHPRRPRRPRPTPTSRRKRKVEAGQLKFLAIATEKRHPEMPSVPTRGAGVNVWLRREPRHHGAERHAGRRDRQARLELRGGREEPFAQAMKQGTDVRRDGRTQAWLKQNDDLNRNLAKDLGLLKR